MYETALLKMVTYGGTHAGWNTKIFCHVVQSDSRPTLPRPLRQRNGKKAYAQEENECPCVLDICEADVDEFCCGGFSTTTKGPYKRGGEMRVTQPR